MEITSTCQPKLRQLKKNPLVESNHIYSYRTPMRLAMGTWFLYWSVNLRWVQKQEENWKAESISLGKSLGRLVVKVPSFVSKMLRFGWLQITCAWRCSWIFFSKFWWLGYGEGEENVWRWWYWKSLTHLCLYISFYIIYFLTWILQESSYSAMFSRKARIEISSILMMHLDWTRAMQSGGHKVGCSKSGRAWRLCILDSWFEMLATLPPSLQLPEKESD